MYSTGRWLVSSRLTGSYSAAARSPIALGARGTTNPGRTEIAGELLLMNTATDVETLHQGVEKIEPVLRENAPVAEQLGLLPDASVDAMREAGLYRMWIPGALGGLGIDPVSSVDLVEKITRTDAAGWNLCMSATPTLLMADGVPVSLIAFLPRADAEIIDNWDTLDMCGTGSHDVAVTDRFVPEHRAPVFAPFTDHPPGSAFQDRSTGWSSGRPSRDWLRLPWASPRRPSPVVPPSPRADRGEIAEEHLRCGDLLHVGPRAGLPEPDARPAPRGRGTTARPGHRSPPAH
jgi:hypothetical protein